LKERDADCGSVFREARSAMPSHRTSLLISGDNLPRHESSSRKPTHHCLSFSRRSGIVVLSCEIDKERNETLASIDDDAMGAKPK
jgi:hypothetical protein